jgi:hypothetical protein
LFKACPPNKASPNHQALIVSLKKVNGFQTLSMSLRFDLASPLYFITLPFRELLDAWKIGSLAFRLSHGLKVNAGRESFFMALDCVKCFDLKGFGACQ